MKKETPKKRKITFSLENIEAQQVYLVGDFNGWDVGAHPMKHSGNGKWKKQLVLPQGQFEYKFLADDQWLSDPNNERTCPNCFGTKNSVVNVIV